MSLNGVKIKSGEKIILFHRNKRKKVITAWSWNNMMTEFLVELSF